MRDLFRFCEEATQLVAIVIQALVPEYRDGFASNDFLLLLAQTLDLFMVMDNLKNAKSSLNNDFSMYKRYGPDFLRAQLPILLHSTMTNLKNVVELEDETVENHHLYTFLGTQNVFGLKLKERLGAIGGYDELLIDMVNACASMFDNRLYLTPAEKHSLLKVRSPVSILIAKAMTFGLYLLDQENDHDRDITKKKRLRLEKVSKILKVRNTGTCSHCKYRRRTPSSRFSETCPSRCGRLSQRALVVVHCD